MLWGVVPASSQEAQGPAPGKTLQKAIASISLQAGEEVIDAVLTGERDNQSYVVKILGKDGQVREVTVDAGAAK